MPAVKELRREVARWQRTWEQFETEIEDILDAGEKVVLRVAEDLLRE